MLPEVEKMTPTQRLVAGRCPECGRNMAGLNPLAERDYHWDVEPLDRPASREALARYNMLTDFAAEQEAKAEALRVDARRAAASQP